MTPVTPLDAPWSRDAATVEAASPTATKVANSSVDGQTSMVAPRCEAAIAAAPHPTYAPSTAAITRRARLAGSGVGVLAIVTAPGSSIR